MYECVNVCVCDGKIRVAISHVSVCRFVMYKSTRSLTLSHFRPSVFARARVCVRMERVWPVTGAPNGCIRYRTFIVG